MNSLLADWLAARPQPLANHRWARKQSLRNEPKDQNPRNKDPKKPWTETSASRFLRSLLQRFAFSVHCYWSISVRVPRIRGLRIVCKIECMYLQPPTLGGTENGS